MKRKRIAQPVSRGTSKTYLPRLNEMKREAELPPYGVPEADFGLYFLVGGRFNLCSGLFHVGFLSCFLPLLLLIVLVFPHAHRHEPPWLDGKVPGSGNDYAAVWRDKIIASLPDFLSNGMDMGTSLLD